MGPEEMIPMGNLWTRFLTWLDDLRTRFLVWLADYNDSQE